MTTIYPVETNGRRIMEIYERFREDLKISTDRGLLDKELIWEFLARQSYWQRGVDMKKVEAAIQNSICFGVYRGKKQIAYTRVVTDFSIIAYVMDFFILEEFRGLGIGNWLIECVLAHPDLSRVKRWMLRTHHQHDLFAKFGFDVIDEPDTVMIRISDTSGYHPPQNGEGDAVGE